MASDTASPTNEMGSILETKTVLTPPTSEEADKHNESGSDLSDLEYDGDDIGEILPDHYYEGGKIPVFKPTMAQFHSFKTFIDKIDKYGMRSGIVKVIPPKEWHEKLPALDEQVKTIKVKNPITQEFHGTHGTYTQANIEKQRSYNLPQWKALSEESNHQPPAKRGERRRNQEKVTRGAGSSTRTRNSSTSLANGKKRGPGRPRVRPLPTTVHKQSDDEDANEPQVKVEVPPTPTSPVSKPVRPVKFKKELSDEEDDVPVKAKGRQPKSVSSRRKNNRQDQADVVDEEAFKDFDYRVHNQSDWTPERCSELETAYWKSLTFNNPMYGADMPGSLFDDVTENWNVAKLENILDVLGQNVPGVNTAYLYLGMWKATFAWHLEDVDLYSINYIHFGAPKQWYSISQEDARRFESAMRAVWPNDAKNCDQFLRHKTYLISPALLQSQYNIKVNRLVHHEGEFVITFPYGYHSGYNLGYNCAESVNFATDAWLQYGKVAKKCHCEADSVWIDVEDVERKLRGEPTPEYYEETDDDEDEDEDDDEDDGVSTLPTPPGSIKGKPKARIRKRKRDLIEKDDKPKVKRLRIKIKAPTKEPCALCPNDNAFEELLPTDNGLKAHRRCAIYTPETYIACEGESAVICDVNRIDKARLELKCNYCRNKSGAVFQCSQKKCTRAYHATCAMPGGVQVDQGTVPVFGEDGTEYTDTGIDFRCRFHRIKRGKHVEGPVLEELAQVRKAARNLTRGEVVQAQYYQSEIFAGTVLENRISEQALLIEVLPKGDQLEVEWKWLLIMDKANSQLPKPSANAKPLPAHLARKSKTSAQDPSDNNPKADEPFCDPKGIHVWSEFHTAKLDRNPAQVKIDFAMSKRLWFYLGRTSTEAKAQYTGDLSIQRNDPEANFLESVKPPPLMLPPLQRRSFPAVYPAGVNIHALNAARIKVPIHQAHPLTPKERPYTGKYAITDTKPYEYKPRTGVSVDSQALRNQRAFQHSSTMMPQSQQSNATSNYPTQPAHINSMVPMAPMIGGHQPYSSPQSSDLENYLKWTRTAHNQPQQRTQYNPQPQAPVANMMGGTTTSNHDPFSGALGSSRVLSIPDRPPPSINGSSDISGRVQLHSTSKYPYLLAAEKARAKVYQSPYKAGGGFTDLWLPCPKKIFVRGPTLSEQFRIHSTLEQQEQINICRQKMAQVREIAQKDKQNRQQQRQRDQVQQSLQQSKPSHEQSNHQYQQQSSYALDSQYSGYTTYQLQSYPQSYHQENPRPKSQYHYHPQSPNLYQSPQDIQMRMLQQTHPPQQNWTRGQTSYADFMGGVQQVGMQGGQGRAESPLRHEMGNPGSEMLPMMAGAGERGASPWMGRA